MAVPAFCCIGCIAPLRRPLGLLQVRPRTQGVHVVPAGAPILIRRRCAARHLNKARFRRDVVRPRARRRVQAIVAHRRVTRDIHTIP